MEIGVDIVEVDRIKKAIENGEFLTRIFTEREINAFKDKKGEGYFRHIAGRFAAKEAVSKALCTGIRFFGWHDIEILTDALGKPEVRLHGRAFEILKARGYSRVLVTISHSKDYAVAFSIAEEGNRCEGCQPFDYEGYR
ncbi:holo-ACP synthase [Thermosediminibacter oceani]|uniref:Holo-[acyl-carrier-protein] synthase n=1 Tax=Thermosediminibacter oceani (strain ATCC BAA-1034 / DSM 16646 / JW/IW-1228P) TaxID=555079 RepID=D9RZ92_THEOJ|nr:holo-ACP synthase [Thermosediminibacter oceani]ADL08646.1 holo-acyl-carrier-protein synthase [Thermosediminibacter oceani DSM 16646]